METLTWILSSSSWRTAKFLPKLSPVKAGILPLIASEAVIFDNLSILDATSALGISGSINIEAPTQFISSVVQALPQEPVDVATLYAARCVAGKGGHFSTFVDSKSDSLTPAPGTYLSSPLPPVMNPAAQTASDSAPLVLANYLPSGMLTDGEASTCP